ncbi:MAG: ABC transporter substrate-binding protein [Clostridiales bacterium]|nr:ABC transporter substrate-binding protein [Clostridiales bacterium]
MEEFMKKITVWFLCLLMLAMPMSLTACKSDEEGVIRLSEVTHSIFYAPLYVAINNGYFEDEGITIELSNAGGADKVMTAIASKSADIGLMGPEATIYCHVEGQRDYPVIFGQLTQRDGSFLVSRKEELDFEWSDLEGKHVLAGRAGGVPAMTLQYVVETLGGLSLSQLNFDTTVAFDLMVGAFEGDTSIDYCTMFEPTASDFVAAGKGYIVASVGEAAGDVPFTAFSASKSYLEENRELVKKFLACVKKGYDFIVSSDSMAVADALAPSFSGESKQLMASSVERYLSINAWCSSPVMSKASFDSLQDIMQNAGTLDERADFSLAVDNSIAMEL